MPPERPSSSLSMRSEASDVSTNANAERLGSGSVQLAQPWKNALKAERAAGNNPLTNWTPNKEDFGEKPWLKIDWSKDEHTGPGGVRSQAPDQMCGYSVGNLKLH